MISKLKIGNVELNNNIILGPMAGLTDRPFRIICERFNPGLVVTEMVSAKALLYGDEKTKKLMNTEGENNKRAIQIFGSDEEAMAFAANYISENKLSDIIDINMGCPAPKIVKNGDGSKLLNDIKKAEKVAKSVVENTNLPVTVKIRKGWDNNNIVAVDIAKALEQAGVSAITVHGRTRNEFYSGEADWDIIRKVKDSIKIPVIGNGDITTPEKAKEMFETTNCDGIMISRATLGNPWIIEQVLNFLSGKPTKNISKDEKLKTILNHINLEIEEKGELVGIKEMRKHICFYLKGEANASELRNRINHLEKREDVENALKDFFK